MGQQLRSLMRIFQSTPSAWRETAAIYLPGEGVNISIHSLRMEGDLAPFKRFLLWRYFNPLPPHGGRLDIVPTLRLSKYISIHSLRMEGDAEDGYLRHLGIYFNPLPPHGGRRDFPSINTQKRAYFNPLPPHGGRQCNVPLYIRT